MLTRAVGRGLVRQWMAFAVVLSLLFVALSLLSLYLLEDRFLDEKLREVARSVTSVRQAPSLPAGFRLFAEDELPADLRLRFQGRGTGAHSEFRGVDGRYVHAMRSVSAKGEAFVLVYDVTDELTVNGAIARYWHWVLALVVAFALIARALSQLFMARWTQGAERLLREVRESESPRALHDYAARESVPEFAALARLNADAWQAKLDALAREQEMLAFLSHELRTPLQSARASVALIKPQPEHQPVWARLMRAITRMERVSRSIDWLSTQVTGGGTASVEIRGILRVLIEELAPLAERKQAQLILHAPDIVHWPLEADVAETLFANLLLNAIQHGTAGVIDVTLAGEKVTIDNPVFANVAGTHVSSGLGLELAQRWSDKFGLSVTSEMCGHASWRACVQRKPVLPDYLQTHRPSLV